MNEHERILFFWEKTARMLYRSVKRTQTVSYDDFAERLFYIQRYLYWKYISDMNNHVDYMMNFWNSFEFKFKDFLNKRKWNKTLESEVDKLYSETLWNFSFKIQTFSPS